MLGYYHRFLAVMSPPGAAETCKIYESYLLTIHPVTPDHRLSHWLCALKTLCTFFSFSPWKFKYSLVFSSYHFALHSKQVWDVTGALSCLKWNNCIIWNKKKQWIRYLTFHCCRQISAGNGYPNSVNDFNFSENNSTIHASDPLKHLNPANHLGGWVPMG